MQVHIFYEITGTTGAFVTALVLIPQLGNNRAFIITPIAFFFCTISWFFISDLDFEKRKGQVLGGRPGYVRATLGGFWLFFESRNKNVSALGAVMAFLYSFYIVTYAILGTFLGRYLDGVYNATGGSDGGSISSGLVYTAGVQFSIICVLVFASTFVPKGAVAFNPKMLYGEALDNNLEEDEVISSDNSPVIQPRTKRSNRSFNKYDKKSPTIIT